VAEYDASPDEVVTDVAQLIADLRQKKLVTER
jgi:hypothetical protein